MNNYDYPMGADTEDAPWNQEDLKPRTIEVTVSITLSKTVRVEVDNYTIEDGTDEDGNHNTYYDYSDCDLEQAVRDQIPLPTDEGQEFNDWSEDDFAVNLEG